MHTIDLPVVLMVQTAEINVTEPDGGQFTTVRGCFTANLTQPRAMDHLFQFVLSPSSTAGQLDFYPNVSSPILTIPANVTNSQYTTCVDIVIIGDNVAEPPEFVIYTIAVLSPEDSVVYPPGFDSLIINIFDNDNGKVKLILRLILN